MSRFRLIQTLFVCTALSLAACSDDDDNSGFNGETDDGTPTVDRVDPAQVFTGRLPVSVAGMQISYDTDGLVKQISRRSSGTNEIVTFSYPSLSKTVSEGKLVRMDVVSSNERHQFNLRIGKLGFAEYAEEVEYNGNKVEDTDYWWFTYTPEGRLSKIEHTDENGEQIVFTYVDGNMVNMKLTNRDGDDLETTVSYGTKPVSNVGGIMLFDEIFNTDMDEMEYAYYAGLLGKSTVDLPQSAQHRTGKYTQNVTFSWTLDTEGYPVSMTPSNEPFSYTFAWL